MVILAIPLIFGCVKPNPIYGFRTTRTQRDPCIWYPVNAFAGKRLLTLGSLVIVASIAFKYIPNVSASTYVSLMTAVLVAGVATMAIRCYLYLSDLWDREFGSSHKRRPWFDV